jgi:thiamine-phosphate pyrophosphorylase
VVQYRRKAASDREGEAANVLAICRRSGVPLIINDDVQLAARIGADGVHLGKDDCPLDEARTRLGPDAIIGVSCYDSVEAAVLAQRQGAGYVAFGRFFPSRTKPRAPLAHLETLHEARRLISVPIVAIGGITPENGAQLLAAGAHLLAVIDAVFGAPDPEAAAAAFRGLFAHSSAPPK